MVRGDSKGVALISTFLFVALLFMMAASMVVLSRRSIQTGMSQHHQTQALYLAESGLARAMVALENDLDWPGVTNATIDGMRGTYTVTFGTGKMDSVNNIGTAAAKDSYRGDETVPIDHALLIVQAEVAGQRYVLEALVQGQGSVGYMSDAILSSGKIYADGDLHIDGISALDDATPVDGSLQSNKTGSEVGMIAWSGNGSAFISGTVGTGGSTLDAISMTGATIAGGAPELNTTHNIPNQDITAEIAGNSGEPSPNISNGGTLTGGKHYLSDGDDSDDVPVVVNGDLVLEDDAELYIDGDLVVNGSIKGNGTIWVQGETIFRGDSEVTTNSEFSVSLHSKGSVKLTGFDGSKFLANIDAETQELLAVSELAVQGVQNAMVGSADELNNGVMDELWNWSAAMGLHRNGPTPGVGPIVTHYVLGEERSNVIGQLRNKVNNLPSGETKAFLNQRLQTLQKIFTSADDLPGGPNWQDVLDEFEADGVTQGLLDAALVDYDNNGNDGARITRIWPAVANLVNTINYDKIGAAYFQGAIYTQGFFYADNEVNVLGAIMVDGNGSGQETFNRQVFDPATMSLVDGDPITLSPGDVYLGNRTRVTYVEEFFTDDPTNNSGPQNLAGILWMGR